MPASSDWNRPLSSFQAWQGLQLLGNCDRTFRIEKDEFYARLGRFKNVTFSPQTIEEHLHLKRLERRISLRQLGKQINVHYKTIAKWENNLAFSSEEHRKLIVNFLGYEP